jgi:hypothetical protein
MDFFTVLAGNAPNRAKPFGAFCKFYHGAAM